MNRGPLPRGGNGNEFVGVGLDRWSGSKGVFQMACDILQSRSIKLAVSRITWARSSCLKRTIIFE